MSVLLTLWCCVDVSVQDSFSCWLSRSGWVTRSLSAAQQPGQEHPLLWQLLSGQQQAHQQRRQQPAAGTVRRRAQQAGSVAQGQLLVAAAAAVHRQGGLRESVRRWICATQY
jgi:hypothetical protein